MTKCNPWRWLWGLLPLALLAVIVNLLERPRIEEDLVTRTREALTKAGLGWAATGFKQGGRDGLITGDAVEEKERDKVHDVASAVWGVRTIDNKAKLIDKVDRYAWSATRADKEIRIRGLAPSETDRKTIVKMAETTFPGFQIKDDMKLARGVPDKQAWLAGIDHGFKQLEQLKKGQAELDNLALTVSGDASTTAAYRNVKTALGQLPKGVTLKHERIVAPTVSPFVWQASTEAKRIVLTGFAPSEKARDQVVQDARQRFQGRTVVDQMEVASGAPRDWERAVDVGLVELALLETGTARLSDVDLAVSGATELETTKDGIARDLKAKLPPAFRGSEKVTFKVAKLAGVSPYVTSASVEGDALVVTGHVPSEDARKSLLAYAKGQFPSRRIVDNTNLATGQPDVWMACSEAGLRALNRLGNGRFELKDRGYAMTGSTTDEGLYRGVPADLRSGAPAGCEGNARIELIRAAAPSPPPPAMASPMVKVDTCQKALDEVMKGGVIQFERAKADLKSDSFPTLDKLADVAKTCPKTRIEIGGHTDARGAADMNQRLSEQRAQAVAGYLGRKGIDENRLFAIGYGPSRPVAPNDTDEDRARNRRIEFVLKPN